MSDEKRKTIWERIEEIQPQPKKDQWGWVKEPKGVGRPKTRGVKKGTEPAIRGGFKRRKPTGKPIFIGLSDEARSMVYVDPSKSLEPLEPEKFNLGDECEMKYHYDGSIEIGKNCEGKELNSVEISILDRVQTEIDKKDEA
jgi:hypothetical protein